jgi:hypothetical protein
MLKANEGHVELGVDRDYQAGEPIVAWCVAPAPLLIRNRALDEPRVQARQLRRVRSCWLMPVLRTRNCQAGGVLRWPVCRKGAVLGDATRKRKETATVSRLSRSLTQSDPASRCGPQPNVKLLLNYGFVDEDNPYDRITVEVGRLIWERYVPTSSSET